MTCGVIRDTQYGVGCTPEIVRVTMVEGRGPVPVSCLLPTGGPRPGRCYESQAVSWPSIMFRCLGRLEDTTLFGTNISSCCLGSAFVSVELGNPFWSKPYCRRRICYHARTRYHFESVSFVLMLHIPSSQLMLIRYGPHTASVEAVRNKFGPCCVPGRAGLLLLLLSLWS
ncbi:uncharacterized protein LY79DRAFT_245008 [Colletotrichum navitas]|uniref:Uncharacterized protein n=1 Tax=Colletotrichum navitas TaxID=681940 RepID=A0AAD8V245_9PEZI|nr:uncharacterized protein LY79DRAFT_245008 [Colletotrichum navitas]KAK1586041.1 hypothetical protein LY79DRAFT_245008 [Colletotrichum navitas]